MKKLIIPLLCIVPVVSQAAPFIVSDPTAQTVTHCGILLDSAAVVDVPVVKDTTGSFCKYDLKSVTAGIHTAKATFINIDPVWGRSESVASAPFTFTKPPSVILLAPAGLEITP